MRWCVCLFVLCTFCENRISLNRCSFVMCSVKFFSIHFFVICKAICLKGLRIPISYHCLLNGQHTINWTIRCISLYFNCFIRLPIYCPWNNLNGKHMKIIQWHINILILIWEKRKENDSTCSNLNNSSYNVCLCWIYECAERIGNNTIDISTEFNIK